MREKPHQVVIYHKTGSYQQILVEDAAPVFAAFKAWLADPVGAHRVLEVSEATLRWMIDLDTVQAIRESKP